VFFFGSVGIADLETSADALDRVDRQAPGLSRLVDTSQITAVDLDFEAMRRFAARRNRSSPDHGVRTAILAEANMTFVYARIFQALHRRPNVVIGVFRHWNEALAWLAGPEIGRARTEDGLSSGS
jgi:hypothetical protein